MVLGFIGDDKKFHPTGDTNRSPTGQRITSDQLLPKGDTQEDRARRSKQILKFAGRKAKLFAKGTRATAEKGKNILIERSINQQKEIEDHDRQIDDILDDSTTSDSSKFRRLQRFGLLFRNRLSKQQLKVVNDSLEELDTRIQKRRKGEIPVKTGGMTVSKETNEIVLPKQNGITPEEFQKLPESLKEQIRVISQS